MQLNRYESYFLLAGDVAVFYGALWLTLLLRYWEVPSGALWSLHAVPFTYLLIVSMVVFFIAGLYDQHTSFFRRKLPGRIAYAQLSTVTLAALFFFLVPYFGITPKTILVIFLVVSSVLAVVWRLYLTRFLGVRRTTNVLVLGKGAELQELVQEIQHNPRYGMHIAHQFAPEELLVSDQLQTQMLEFITREHISVIVADTHDPHMRQVAPVFYNLLLLHPDLMFFDTFRLYESIFRRMPVSKLEHTWFLEHITRQPRPLYALFHRSVDLMVGVLVGVVWLLVLPFVWLAVRLEDGGPLYVEQMRIGQHNQPIRIKKFRTMSGSDSGTQVLQSTLTITRTGRVLRPTRIDELPQFLNLLRGDLSFIGPRPELPALAALYAEEIPYYNSRHLIQPGLTGWAQLYHDAHPHHGTDVEETRNKLSYDLYYLKHRTVLLDIETGLKTITKVLTRSGA